MDAVSILRDAGTRTYNRTTRLHEAPGRRVGSGEVGHTTASWSGQRTCNGNVLRHVGVSTCTSIY